jgi:AcrR family transcriptional regulator
MNIHSVEGGFSHGGNVTKITQAHIDARTADILRAAKAVIHRRGAEAATMQDVATEAGLSAGAIYRYFSGKDELLRQVIQHLIGEHEALFGRPALSAATPLDALLNVGRAVTVDGDPGFFVGNLESIVVAARDKVTAEGGRVVRERAIELIAEHVVAAQNAGQLDPALDAQLVATVLFCLTTGFGAVAVALGDGMDREAVWGMAEEMIRRLAPKEIDHDA